MSTMEGFRSRATEALQEALTHVGSSQWRGRVEGGKAPKKTEAAPKAADSLTPGKLRTQADQEREAASQNLHTKAAGMHGQPGGTVAGARGYRAGSGCATQVGEQARQGEGAGSTHGAGGVRGVVAGVQAGKTARTRVGPADDTRARMGILPAPSLPACLSRALSPSPSPAPVLLSIPTRLFVLP